jgi:hypothetical protein
VVFTDPLVNAFSVQSGAYGVSSVLVDDSDFAHQPIANHLNQARFIGVRYLVVSSEHARIRLEHANDIVARHDFGRWSIFELHNDLPNVRALAFKPALVISSLSLKARRRTDYYTIRRGTVCR